MDFYICFFFHLCVQTYIVRCMHLCFCIQISSIVATFFSRSRLVIFQFYFLFFFIVFSSLEFVNGIIHLIRCEMLAFIRLFSLYAHKMLTMNMYSFFSLYLPTRLSFYLIAISTIYIFPLSLSTVSHERRKKINLLKLCEC